MSHRANPPQWLPERGEVVLPSIEEPEEHQGPHHGEIANKMLVDIRDHLERYDAATYTGSGYKRARDRTPTPYPFEETDSSEYEGPSPKRARYGEYEHNSEAEWREWCGSIVTPGCPYHTQDEESVVSVRSGAGGVKRTWDDDDDDDYEVRPAKRQRASAPASPHHQLTADNLARLSDVEGFGEESSCTLVGESLGISEDTTLCGSSSGYEGDVEKGFGAEEEDGEDEEEGDEGDDYFDGVMVHMAQMEEGRLFQEGFDEF